MTERAARLQTASTFKTTSLRMNLSPSQLRVLKEQQRKDRVSAKENVRKNRVLDKEMERDDERSDKKESRRRTSDTRELSRQKSQSDRERMTKKRGQTYSRRASGDLGGSPDGESQLEVEKRFDLKSEGYLEQEDESVRTRAPTQSQRQTSWIPQGR